VCAGTASFQSKSWLRAEANFASRFKAIGAFNPSGQNISLYQK
jgi:hypothetical protein